ncbi:hypothetical protein CRYUN_Cryun13aG0064000 [Craigia yunnanensis]
METRKVLEVLERLRMRVRYDNYFYINLEGLSGDLALWWNNEVKVRVLEATKNCIDSLATLDNKGYVSRVCWMYRSTNFDERRNHWEYIKKSMAIFNIPWMCIGDFNKVKDNEEKGGGNLRSRRRINCFYDFINNCELSEVPFKKANVHMVQ